MVRKPTSSRIRAYMGINMKYGFLKLFNKILAFLKLLLCGFLFINITSGWTNPLVYNFPLEQGGKVAGVFGCPPSFAGRVGLGAGSYVDVWQCSTNIEGSYVAYKLSYTSKFRFNFSGKDEATDFFLKYLDNGLSIHQQDPRVSQLRRSMISTVYTSRNEAYADFFVVYRWDGVNQILRQGRLMFRDGYIFEWTVTGFSTPGYVANHFNAYSGQLKMIP